MICASSVVAMPWMRKRVVCGFFDVMLTFSPTSAFISVDLPTLGRPTIATWPHRNSGAIGLIPDRARDRDFGGGLLGRAPAVTAPGRDDIERRNAAFNFKRLRVRLAGRR